MASQTQAITMADLHTIENNLISIHNNLSALDNNVATVDKNVSIVYDEIGTLANDFKAYVQQAAMQHELELATSQLGNIRQELETKYGHYAEVRRTTTGILQATDLGIVQNSTITTTTEELMLDCPRYWLAPCLVALASWINNREEIAEKALKEALRRDDEKTSLLFGLICRRAGRKHASLKWVNRYLQNQDPENLGRETIVVLDAYAAGLFSTDSENMIGKQLSHWIDLLSAKPGFLEDQSARWKDALNSKRTPLAQSEYTYLRKYSRTWKTLEDVMEGARLHQTVLDYFQNVFAQPTSQEAIKDQLDDILSTLVTSFDDEELPLRSDEHLCELIIEYEGDKKRAKSTAAQDQAALEESRDLMQLLTDAAMHPELSKSSTSSQKFAISLSKEWIASAYGDLRIENLTKVPQEIEINIDSYNGKTQDGTDEVRLLGEFDTLISSEKEAELNKTKLTSFDQFCQFGGIGCAVIGLISSLSGIVYSNTTLTVIGVLAMVAGAGLIFKYTSRKRYIDLQRDMIERTFEEKREKGKRLLKAVVAEIVDFRIEFEEKDDKNSAVSDFLAQLSTSQYVKTVAGSVRKVEVND